MLHTPSSTSLESSDDFVVLADQTKKYVDEFRAELDIADSIAKEPRAKECIQSTIHEVKGFTAPTSEEMQKLLAAMSPEAITILRFDLQQGRERTKSDLDHTNGMHFVPVLNIISTVRNHVASHPDFVWNPPSFQEVQENKRAFYNLYVEYNKQSVIDLKRVSKTAASHATIDEYVVPLPFEDFEQLIAIDNENTAQLIRSIWAGHEMSGLHIDVEGANVWREQVTAKAESSD